MLLLGKEERHAIFESNILETATFSKSKKKPLRSVLTKDTQK